MKNYIVALLMLAASITVQGQARIAYSATNWPGDTVVNTATKFVTTQAITTTPASTTSVHFKAALISGTGAGTATLLGSNDGIIFSSISATSYTITNVASQGFIWQLTGSPVVYYRVSVTGSGTESLQIKANAYTH